jgi:hypothetical protein
MLTGEGSPSCGLLILIPTQLCCFDLVLEVRLVVLVARELFPIPWHPILPE